MCPESYANRSILLKSPRSHQLTESVSLQLDSDRSENTVAVVFALINHILLLERTASARPVADWPELDLLGHNRYSIVAV